VNKCLILYFVCFYAITANSQLDPDSTRFISPIHHAITISGSFGELRPNHFHSGIDLKSSKGVDGDIVMSAEDGYVSRIKIQASGYGNALYIDHPNGYTTVYAHLASFNAELDSFVKAKQYALKSFALDLYLAPNEIRLSKGETIGYMGNSGRSYGTHLHFEIRETISEHVMNPFLFGIVPEDTKNPQLKQVLLYSLDKDFIPTAQKTLKVKKSKSGALYLSSKPIEIDGWRLGIGIDTYDWMDGSWNKNGIYSSDFFVDDSLVFTVLFDEFSFDQTRYANACIDYQRKQKKGGNRVMKLYKEPGNALEIYDRNGANGVIPIYADKTQEIKIRSMDFHGNASEVRFDVKRKSEVSPIESRTYNYYFHYDSINIIQGQHLNIELPESSLYRNHLFQFSQEGNTFTVGDKTIPCHRYYTIRYDLSGVPNLPADKVCLLFKNGKGFKSFGGKVENNVLIAKTNRFGSFKIGIDTIPPTISKVSKNKSYKHEDLIDFTIKDNTEVLGSASDVSIHVYIDSEWTLHYFDKKKNRIRVPVEARLSKGQHSILVTAADNLGNTQRYSTNFSVK